MALSHVTKVAYVDLLPTTLTNHPVDNNKATLVLASAKALGPDHYNFVLDLVLAKRQAYKVWVTLQQRKWQTKSRRPQRANHHDSVAIREQYVRC